LGIVNAILTIIPYFYEFFKGFLKKYIIYLYKYNYIKGNVRGRVVFLKKIEKLLQTFL